MKHFKHDIGCAAGSHQIHATRLAIQGNDSAGAGSAAQMDEGLDEYGNPIEGEGASLDGEEGRTRNRRQERQNQAYDELKGDRDRLRAENEQQKREFQGLQDRLAAVETRSVVNERTNSHLDLAKARSREVVEDIRKLDRDDPDYSVKVYEAMFSKLYTDLPKAAEEISRRTSSDVVREDRSQAENLEAAKRETYAALKDAGLGEEHFDAVQDLAILKGVKDKDWFRRVAPEDQIHELVQSVKDRMIKTTRSSREFQDDKRSHRAAMDGVIGEGSRGNRIARRGEAEDEGQPEGPGSILADLARLRAGQRRNTNIMLRQTER